MCSHLCNRGRQRCARVAVEWLALARCGLRLVLWPLQAGLCLHCCFNATSTSNLPITFSSRPHAGYALFGPNTDGDVLKNLTSAFVSTLLPAVLADAVVYFIALSFVFNLLVNFVLKVRPGAASSRGTTGSHGGWHWPCNPIPQPPPPPFTATQFPHSRTTHPPTHPQVWAVRENLCDLALGMPAHRLPNPLYYAVTGLLVVVAYAISIMVPSVYVSSVCHYDGFGCVQCCGSGD